MAETRDAEQVQSALYRIAELAGAARDLQEFYAAVHGIVGELMYADNFFIALYDEERQLISWPYYVDVLDDDLPDPNRWDAFGEGDARGTTAYVLRTREPQLLPRDRQFELISSGEIELVGVITEHSCWLGVPLKADDKTLGALVVQSYAAEHQYDEQDRDLLAFVGQHVGAALSRARAIEETRQRNAELALINSVQEALAGELELQAIYDVVGDKIQEVFDAQIVDIAAYDESTGMLTFPYTIERGVRLFDEPWPLVGFRKHVMETGESLVINEDMLAARERYGNPTATVGEIPLSGIWVPLVTGGKATGVISLQNADREHAFSESDERLLVTLAASLSVALENARLVHETRQRNAELALINSVQEAIAGELDPQAIYELVGDKIQEVFDAQVVSISTYDESSGLLGFPYVIERGRRHEIEPIALVGFRKHVIETREPLVINENSDEAARRYGNPLVLGGDPIKSAVFVPLVAGRAATGVVSLQNLDREHAFPESDVRLLVTLAGSLSVALDNARLVHETRQRNAELALINSVQEAIAGELDPQSIYDLVGDKIQEVFDAQVVDIAMHDEVAGLLRFPYTIERGVRFRPEPIPLIGFRRHVLETGEPLMIDEASEEVAARYGNPFVLAGEPVRSSLFVPLGAGGKPTGVISLQNLDREHAFSDGDQRLLVTLAGSLSVALENARLVHETRQRNAELALINSVQDAIAGELDPQSIYDLVGDKIQEVFDAQVVNIAVLDDASGMLEMPYSIERGSRQSIDPIPLIGFRKHVMETGEPLMLNENVAAEAERYGNPMVLSGEMPKSDLFVPLIVAGRATGVISLQNVDREHAFTESDQRLLVTLAGSLSVALDNARLVHETRQRNAELALINSVQEALAGELELQAIYDVVGDKIQEVFDAQVVDIAVLDDSDGLLHFPYTIERGERLADTPIAPTGFRQELLERHEPFVLNEFGDEVLERLGLQQIGEVPKAALWMPLVVGGRGRGWISLQNLDHEHAFSESDIQLLDTIAGSLGVALENARLVHETRQRVTELGTVNSVGQALASRLHLEELIELVGERVRETFAADIAYVALHDEAAGRIDYVYYHESGERRPEPALRYGQGLTSKIIESGEPLLINREEQMSQVNVVGTPARSYLGVPVYAGERPIGVISVQSTHEEGRYGEADTRLLATLAANVGVAIQNARLFSEIERQREYFESLVEISPVAVIAMDVEEHVTSWNPAATELFGHTAEEAIGRSIDDLVIGEEMREEGREITREALATGRAQRITRRRRKDGTRVDVDLMLVPLVVGGEQVGFLGVYHDITELESARQEAEAATQAKSAFLATMSHEIRTPMNAVIGMTGLLLGTELTPEQREFAEVVRSSGDALLHVIDDILDYSKIEAGKLDLEREPFDLRVCVESALDIVAPRAAEKGLELGALVAEGVPPAIAGDAARLRQVLLNLLSNAVKFTEQGEVVVDLEAEPADAESYRVHLTVRDTGIGIPPDRIGSLFESFSQVDASTTRRYGGTGLGLAISKRLVELMGGRMWVESEVGSGSSFHIELVAGAADLPPRFPVDEAQPQLAGKRLLVVDDNATNREIISRQARSWGMVPVPVEAPSRALALIESGEPFDVGVLDMVMPEMDGRELAREIRRHRSQTDMPLLLVTSLGRLPQAREADGFSAQLAKPLKASQLYDALMRVFADRDGGEAPAAAGEAGAEISPLRILLAEDNAVNQKVALALLKNMGYRADVVWNGVEALEALERQPYDVVLMDVQMPELDGLDTARRICERWPAGERPRIVAMTANALQEDRDACFAAGMDDYVAKPIRPEALAEALRRV
jgi:PAS domain S-box-containing protein